MELSETKLDAYSTAKLAKGATGGAALAQIKRIMPRNLVADNTSHARYTGLHGPKTFEQPDA